MNGSNDSNSLNDWLLIMLHRYLLSRAIPPPHILTIEITSYCNLSCVMCPKTAGSVNTVPDRVITMDVIDGLEPILPYIDGVDLSGLWGEAFLHPELYLEILGRLKRRHAGVRTVSNGTLITPEIADRIVELGLDGLDVSVDAARPETYRGIRCGGELEQVVNGLKAISRAKKRTGRSTPEIRMLFIGMADNIEELPEFVRLARALDVTKIVLQSMGEYESVRGQSVSKRYRELGSRLLGEARAVADGLGVTIELFPPDQFSGGTAEGASAASENGPRTKDCFFAWDRAVITTGGDVLPCCSSPHSFGSLKEKAFLDIWYGEDYNRLRRSLLDGDLPLMCRSCTGTGWKGISGWDNAASVIRLERIRLRQRLRRSPALRRAKSALTRPAR